LVFLTLVGFVCRCCSSAVQQRSNCAVRRSLSNLAPSSRRIALQNESEYGRDSTGQPQALASMKILGSLVM
jgi:hypothetical protein